MGVLKVGGEVVPGAGEQTEAEVFAVQHLGLLPQHHPRPAEQKLGLDHLTHRNNLPPPKQLCDYYISPKKFQQIFGHQ